MQYDIDDYRPLNQQINFFNSVQIDTAVNYSEDYVFEHSNRTLYLGHYDFRTDEEIIRDDIIERERLKRIKDNDYF